MKRMNYLLALVIMTVFCLSGCANATPATAVSSVSSSEPSSADTPDIEASQSEPPEEATDIDMWFETVSADEFVEDLPNLYECVVRTDNAFVFYNGAVNIELIREDSIPKGPNKGEASGVAVILSSHTPEINDYVDYQYRSPESAFDMPVIALAFADDTNYTAIWGEDGPILSQELAALMHDLMTDARGTTMSILGLAPELFPDGSSVLSTRVALVMTGENADVTALLGDSNDVFVWEQLEGQQGYYQLYEGEAISGKIEMGLMRFSPNILEDAVKFSMATAGEMVSAVAAPSEDESGSLEGLEEMQETTSEQRKEFEAIVNGDFSNIAGVYKLDKATSNTLGRDEFIAGTTMTISDDGEVKFSHYKVWSDTEWKDVMHYDLIFEPRAVEETQKQAMIEKIRAGINAETGDSRDLYVKWGVEHLLKDTPTERYSLVTTLTYYPENAKIALYKEGSDDTYYVNPAMPTSVGRKRILIGQEGNKYIDRYTVAFTQIDEEEHQDIQEGAKQAESKATGFVNPFDGFVILSNMTEEWPNGFEFYGYEESTDGFWLIEFRKYLDDAEFAYDKIMLRVLDLQENSADGREYYNVEISTSTVPADPQYRAPTVELIGSPEMAVMRDPNSPKAGWCLPSGLAEYLRDVMENGLPE